MDSAAFGGLLPSDQAAAQPLYSLGAKLSLFGAVLLVLVEGHAADRIRSHQNASRDSGFHRIKMRAFMNPVGRAAAVWKASASCSSRNVCVNSGVGSSSRLSTARTAWIIPAR